MRHLTANAIVAASLILAVLLGLAGCGDDDGHRFRSERDRSPHYERYDGDRHGDWHDGERHYERREGERHYERHDGERHGDRDDD